MMSTSELKIRLPLHKHYDKVGWHWGKHSTESIEIVNHETFKDKDVEILTVKIKDKDKAPMHWLSIVSNEHSERTPEAVVEFIPYYPALPTPFTPKTPKMSAAARVAIHLDRMDPPPHPMVLSAGIKPGG